MKLKLGDLVEVRSRIRQHNQIVGLYIELRIPAGASISEYHVVYINGCIELLNTENFDVILSQAS